MRISKKNAYICKRFQRNGIINFQKIIIMYYHIKTKHKKVQENGKEAVVSEEFLVNNCELHGEAEAKGYEYASTYSLNEFDVASVKRSNIREFVNEPSGDTDEMIYDVVIADVFIDENSGKEKEITYHVGVFAISVKDATNKVQEYMKQGFNDMKFLSVKETKIIEIL